MTTGLKQEVNLRKELENTFDKKIDATAKETNNKIQQLKGALWLATALGGIVATLFVTWICGWLQF